MSSKWLENWEMAVDVKVVGCAVARSGLIYADAPRSCHCRRRTGGVVMHHLLRHKELQRCGDDAWTVETSVRSEEHVSRAEPSDGFVSLFEASASNHNMRK